MTLDSKVFLDLAALCEASKGPDKVLAAEIACALRGYTIHEDADPASGRFAYWLGEPWKSECVNCSSWVDPTASLDVAMTLVPEGWRVMKVGEGPEGMERHSGLEYDGSWFACLHRPGKGLLNNLQWGSAANPALALTAACLRARAAEGAHS